MVTGLSQPAQPTTDGHTDEKLLLIRNLFIGAVVGILRAENIIRPDDPPTHPAVNDAIDKWLEFTQADWSIVALNVPDAVVSFEHWIADKGYTWTPPVLYTVSNLTITGIMNTASGQLSVGMTIYPAEGFDMGEIIREAKRELQDAIGRAFSGTQPPPLPETTGRTQNSEFATIKSIRVEAKDGQMYYRMIPASGRWIKYGVALYPDKKSEFNIPDMMPGEYPAQGTFEYSVKPDGKPDRVIGYKR